MWSDRYYYLNIYKDENLSEYSDTSRLRDYISTIPELKEKGKCEFENTEKVPFIQLLMLNSSSIDNWSSEDTNSKRTNLITIVCAKGEEIDFNEIKIIFIKIASFLNWNLVDEETDEGIENYKIWEP